MAVTVVNSVSNVSAFQNATSGTLNIVLPADLQPNDIVVASIRTQNTTLTVPTGWTLMGVSSAAAGAIISREYLLLKDTVSAAESSTLVSVAYAASTTGITTYYSVAVFRDSSRYGVFVSVSSAVLNNIPSGQLITVPSVTATNARELLVVGYMGGFGSISGFTTPSGLTLATVTSGYEAIHYQELTTGNSNSSTSIGWGFSGVTNSAAAVIVARIKLLLNPETVSDAIGAAETSVTTKWNLRTTAADSLALTSLPLFGRTYPGSLADALTFAADTTAINPVFSLVSMSDGFSFSESASAFSSYSMINPISGKPIYRDFGSTTAVSGYSSAANAFDKWSNELGLMTRDENYATTLEYSQGVFVELGFSPIATSGVTRIFIGSSGQLNFFDVLTSFGYTADTVTRAYNDIGWDYSVWPTQIPLLSIGLSRPANSFSDYVRMTNFDFRSGVNATTPFEEAILTFVILRVLSSQTNLEPIRIAFRLKPRYIEVVASPLAAYDSTGHHLQYLVSNSDTGVFTDGRILATDFTSMVSYASLDLSGSVVAISDRIGIVGPANTKIVSAWIATSEILEASQFQDTQNIAYPRVATDLIGFDDPATWAIRYGALIGDSIRFLETTTFLGTYHVTSSDAVALTDALTSAYPVTLAETTNFQDVMQSLTGVVVAESLGLLESPLAKATLYRTFVDLLRINDQLRRFFAGDISETLAIAPTQNVKYNILRQLSETVGILPALSKQLIFRVVADESLQFNDVDLLQMLFNGRLAENVQISAAYIQPGDTTTTWAVNTRTGATTEYSNYNFNSFGQIGHKYVGASSEGLFELQGDDDNGASVIARLKSGYAQFSGSRFTGLKAAYLGVRANGEFVFKIDTGTGDSTAYNIVVQNMQTTKINVGKGIRARYIAFELISTGQDFDLDTIEFVPMPAQRRV